MCPNIYCKLTSTVQYVTRISNLIDQSIGSFLNKIAFIAEEF